MDIKTFVAARNRKLQDRMADLGLDAVILVKPENTFYFSNFNPVLNSHPCFLLITPDKIRLLVHAIRASHAKEEGVIDDIFLYGRWGNNPPIANDPVDAIAVLLGDKPLRLGLELDYVNVNLCNKFREKLSINVISDLSREIAMLKLVKDEYEISMIAGASLLVDLGVETTIFCLEKGLSEAEAATEGQYKMRQMWSRQFPDKEVSGFGTSDGGMLDSLHIWSLTNGHIAYGCDCPRHYYPVSGDVSLPMAWAKLGGYQSENERTVLIGEVTGIREKAYKAMLEARQAVFELLKPGTTFEELYICAAKIFSAHGFEDILPGRIGHGIGNSAHEFPSLEKGNTIPLAAGMCFTVEPGLMDKEWGGARHSDTVVITETGYDCLTKLRRDTFCIHPPKRP